MSLNFLHAFRKDERGAIAMIFGLVIIVLCLFAGIAVDVSRAYGVSSFVSASIDGVALAAARELQKQDMTDAEVQVFAQRHYEALLANRPSSEVQYQPLNIVVNRSDETVEITTGSIVNTFFAGLAGKDTLTINEATTVSYNVHVVELAMMLDVTGSMGGSKIEALRLAAKDVVDLMIADSPRAKSNRIALAPYAAAVNVGALASQVTAPGNDSVDGCVVGRDGVSAAAEDAPGAGAFLTAVDPDPAAVLPDIDPTGGAPANAYSCPDVTVMALSKSKTDLKDHIDDFTDGGWTAGHLGTAWGWYLLSPQWSSIFASNAEPAPYEDEDTIKAVLLMTDGIFNTRYLGATGDTSDELARQLCQNMNNAGIQIYAVAFDAPADAEATLQACASSSEHYFEANNTTQLRNAFQEIASNLTSLRLTK